MANGIQFGLNQIGKIGKRPRNDGTGLKATASSLPVPSSGRSRLNAEGPGVGLTNDVRRRGIAVSRFRRPSRRSNA